MTKSKFCAIVHCVCLVIEKVTLEFIEGKELKKLNCLKDGMNNEPLNGNEDEEYLKGYTVGQSFNNKTN